MSLAAQRLAARGEIQSKREVMRALKTAIEKAKKSRRQRLEQCARECLQRKRKLKRLANTARRKLQQHIRRVKAEARQVCGSCSTINRESLADIDKKLAEMGERAREISELRKQFRGLKSSRGKAGGRRSAEIRAECDDAVRRDVADDPDLVQLWEKLKHKIKATSRMSRTEAFLQWLHDHPESLDELRAANVVKYEKEAEKMYAERIKMTTEEQLGEAIVKIHELESALASCERRTDPYREGPEGLGERFSGRIPF